jgi:hypothetical protein
MVQVLAMWNVNCHGAATDPQKVTEMAGSQKPISLGTPKVNQSNLLGDVYSHVGDILSLTNSSENMNSTLESKTCSLSNLDAGDEK